MQERKGNLTFLVRSCRADVGPPLSTRLGSYFIYTYNFCIEFNKYTLGLPKYFVVKVDMDIFEQGVYTFKIKGVSVTFLLNLIAFDYGVSELCSGGSKLIMKRSIKLKDLYLISKFKFNNCKDVSLKIIYGSVKSIGLRVVK